MSSTGPGPSYKVRDGKGRRLTTTLRAGRIVCYFCGTRIEFRDEVLARFTIYGSQVYTKRVGVRCTCPAGSFSWPGSTSEKGGHA